MFGAKLPGGSFGTWICRDSILQVQTTGTLGRGKVSRRRIRNDFFVPLLSIKCSSCGLIELGNNPFATELNLLSSLEELDLSSNVLWGQLLGLMTSLTRFAVGNRPDPDGYYLFQLLMVPFPLEYLSIIDNGLSGTIPSWVGLLRALTSLDLSTMS
jgi:Leucine-rich repeat (LRR) protein